MTTRTAQAGGAPHGGDAGWCVLSCLSIPSAARIDVPFSRREERMRAGRAGMVLKEKEEHVENMPQSPSHMRVLGPGDGAGADDGADDEVPPICSMEMEEDEVDDEEDAVDPEAMAVDSSPFLRATSSPTPVPEDVDQLDDGEADEGLDPDEVVFENFDVRASIPSKQREYYKKAVESTAVRIVPTQTQTNKRPRPSESPLACDVCGKTFGRPSDTKRHIRTVHLKGADQWTCPGCAREESFSRKDALLRHIHLVHTEDRDRLKTMVRRRVARVPETGGREQRPEEEHRMRPRMPEADREQRPEEEDSTLEADCGEQREPVQENPAGEAERLEDGFGDMVLDYSRAMLADTSPPASALVPEDVDEPEHRTIKQEDLEQPVPRVTDSEDDSSHDEADNESSYGEENSDVPASKGVGREILVDYNTRVASKRPAAVDARSSTPLKRREHFESSSTPSEEYYQEVVESSRNKKVPSGPRFKCRVGGCEKTLSRRADRDRHELTHRGANKWTCPGCSRVLARTDSLMRHIEGVHSAEERDRLKEAVERTK
ncbi:hypothetical protein DFH08DRAFT_837565 [Mycena albidolilacea]|uniref:C2H2-type domain-containing protein n=1 Tax=Mycena albidolilacea TaxID=1033008 RepID=A0AAD7F2S1_9AGAR|nr:hypothetical protein DFH08DRAFT_837565 [Mycena albidolilacea]